jgi:hypothetical protein
MKCLHCPKYQSHDIAWSVKTISTWVPFPTALCPRIVDHYVSRSRHSSPLTTAAIIIPAISISTHTQLLREWEYSHNRPAAIDALDSYIGVPHLRALGLARNEARVAALGSQRFVRFVGADRNGGGEKED